MRHAAEFLGEGSAAAGFELEMELLEFLGKGVAAVGFELEMELLEFLGDEGAVAVEFGLEMEVVETVDVEAVGHESTDMHAEDFDEELG